MGANERASKVRQRETGRRCAKCDTWLGGLAWTGMGMRFCPACEPRPYRVYMHFMRYREGWYVSFALLPAQTALRRTLTFAGEEKLYELARRARASEEVLADLKGSIEAWGRGTVTLQLTEGQLHTLS